MTSIFSNVGATTTDQHDSNAYDPQKPVFNDPAPIVSQTIDEEIEIDFDLPSDANNHVASEHGSTSTVKPQNDKEKDYIPLAEESMMNGVSFVSPIVTQTQNNSANAKQSASRSDSSGPGRSSPSPAADERMYEDELDERTEAGNFLYATDSDGARLTTARALPVYFLTRKSGLVVPLIAVDELPASWTLRGVQRTMTEEAALKVSTNSQILPKPFPRSTKCYEPRATNRAPLQQQHQRSATPDFDIPDAPFVDQSRHLEVAFHNQVPASPPPLGQAPAPPQDNEMLIPQPGEWESRTEYYTKMLSNQWSRQGRVLPGSGSQFGAFPNSKNDSGQIYNPMTKGVFGRKIFCSHWLRTGECDFTQQGCNYLHMMPDLDTMENLGMKQYPRWFRELPREDQVGRCHEFNPAGLNDVAQRHAYVSPPRPNRPPRDAPRGRQYERGAKGPISARPDGVRRKIADKQGRPNALRGAAGKMGPPPVPMPTTQYDPLAQNFLPPQAAAYGNVPMVNGSHHFGMQQQQFARPIFSNSPAQQQAGVYFNNNTQQHPGAPFNSPAQQMPSRPGSPLISEWGGSNAGGFDYRQQHNMAQHQQQHQNRSFRTPRPRNGSISSTISNPLEFQGGAHGGAFNNWTAPDGSFVSGGGAGSKRGSDAIMLAGAERPGYKRPRGDTPPVVAANGVPGPSLSPGPPSVPMSPAPLPPSANSDAHLQAGLDDFFKGGEQAFEDAQAQPLPGNEDPLDYGDDY